MGIIINGQNDTIGPVDNSMSLLGTVSIGGTMTIEDFTNIDSVGVVTARAGVHVTGGNLAVGHNNPSVNLHVRGSASNGQIYLGGTGAHSQIYADNDGVLILNADQGNSAANSYLGFNVDNTERLRVDSSGNLLLKTGEIDIQGGNKTVKTSAGFLQVGTSGSHYLSLITAGSQRLNITSAGNVAIGHNSAPTKLGIRGTSASTDATVQIVGNGVSTLLLGQDAAGGVIRGQGGSNQLKFKVGGNGDDAAATGGVEALRITSNGNIGIGENNPSTPLHVAGSLTLENSSATGNAWTYYKNADRTWLVGVRGSSNDALSFYDLTTDVERLRITSAGLMGVGTDNPATNLDVNGSLQLRASSNSGGYTTYATRIYSRLDSTHCSVIESYLNNSTAFEMMGSYANSGGSNPRVVLAAGGEKVGINETNPRAKLDVRGTALIADDIGSTLPSTFPASDVQLMVYTSTNGQPIGNTNCARILLATDAKQTGPQGYNGAIDFGNSDSTASSQNSQYNYRVASIMSQALADTEANAADGNLEFWTKTSSGSLSKKMGISAEGYVTKTNHPCFDAVRNSGHMSANVYINYNTVKANNGNHYNSSNGRFTAPVAGYYFFSWTSIKNNTNTVTRLYIHKNGSQAYGNRHLRLDGGQDYGDNGTMTAVIQLAVNDYVQIYLGAGAIYGVTEEYCIFNGYLLG